MLTWVLMNISIVLTSWKMSTVNFWSICKIFLFAKAWSFFSFFFSGSLTIFLWPVSRNVRISDWKIFFFTKRKNFKSGFLQLCSGWPENFEFVCPDQSWGTKKKRRSTKHCDKCQSECKTKKKILFFDTAVDISFPKTEKPVISQTVNAPQKEK